MQFTFDVEGFRFETTVRSHGWYRLAPFRWNEATKVLGCTIDPGNGRAVDLELSGDRRLQVNASRRIARGAIEPVVRRMFQMEIELADFHRRCRRMPTHRSVARDRFGRLLCGATRWEDAVKIIATTNTTWRQTVSMVHSLVERFGGRSSAGNRAFPSPYSIAAAGEEELRRECRLGYRAPYVTRLAAMLVDDPAAIDRLHRPEVPAEEQIRLYRTLPGIGPYGAAHLMAMDGRHDFIAVDTEFRRFVRDRHFQGERVDDATMLRRYDSWGRWKYLGYWSELWSEVSDGV